MFHHHKTCTIVHDDFHLHHHLHHLHHLHHHVHNDFQPFPCSTLAHQLNLSRPWAFPLCARHGHHHHHHHRHHHRCHHRHHHYHGQGQCLYVPDSIEEAEPIDNFPKQKLNLVSDLWTILSLTAGQIYHHQILQLDQNPGFFQIFHFSGNSVMLEIWLCLVGRWPDVNLRIRETVVRGQ